MTDLAWVLALAVLFWLSATMAVTPLRKRADLAKPAHRLVIQVDLNDQAVMNLALMRPTCSKRNGKSS